MGWAATGHAQIYKWTDERGSVHYSNSPPPNGVAATQVRPVEERASVYPATPAPSASEEQLRRRVDALEQQLDSERRNRSIAQADAAQQDEQARRRALEECERQRRVDCDRPEVIMNGPPPAVVVGPARRRVEKVVVPVPVKPAPAPNAGIRMPTPARAATMRAPG
jgi:hypothetical protein